MTFSENSLKIVYNIVLKIILLLEKKGEIIIFSNQELFNQKYL